MLFNFIYSMIVCTIECIGVMLMERQSLQVGCPHLVLLL